MPPVVPIIVGTVRPKGELAVPVTVMLRLAVPMLIRPLVLTEKLGAVFGVFVVAAMLPVRVRVLPKVTAVFVAAAVAGWERVTVVGLTMAAIVVPAGMLVPVTGMPTTRPLAPLLARVRVVLPATVVESPPVTVAVRTREPAALPSWVKVKSAKLVLPQRFSVAPPLRVRLAPVAILPLWPTP